MSTEAAEPVGHRFGDFEFHPSRRQLFARGQPVAIGARALDLLTALVERRDRMVSKGELLDLVWPGLVVEENNLQVQISALRKVLGQDAIATNPGRGYRFTAVLEPAPWPAGVPDGRDGPPALAPPHHNLPLPDNALIGRAADCALLVGELASARLVTIVGPAGIGKTRVALAVATGLAPQFADGAWWVDLAGLAHGDALAEAIATTTGQPLPPGEPAPGLARALRAHRMLVVLDNCEHLAADVARLLRQVLESAPGLRVLATSQVPLNLGSEHCYRIEPLTMPGEGETDAAARDAPALALLLERARAVDSRFVVADAQLPLAVAVCRHLDGLPLAIELAAARLPVLGLETLHGMLHQRFALLNSARADVPRRQQALQAALDWSCRLLSRDELEALQHLSVFVASFRLASALEVMAAASAAAGVDTLASLVAKSLVQLDRGEPGSFRLLESTRMHAADGLRRSGRADAARGRWRASMARLARDSEHEFWESSDEAWIRRFRSVQPDIASALEDCAAADEVELAGDLGQTAQLWEYLQNVGSGVRRRKQTVKALLQALSLRDAGQARYATVWNMLTFFAELQPPPRSPLMRVGLESRLAAWRERGDVRQTYLALGALAIRRSTERDPEAARQLLSEAAGMATPAWPPRLLAAHAYACAFTCMHSHDAPGYAEAASRMMALCRRAGAMQEELRSRIMLADAQVLAGEHLQALSVLETLSEESQSRGQTFAQVMSMTLQSLAHLLAGEDEVGRAIAARALPIAHEHFFVDVLLAGAALIDARAGHLERAARLLGSCAQHRPVGMVRWANEARLCMLAHATLVDAVDPSRLAALLAEGAELDREQRFALLHEALAPAS